MSIKVTQTEKNLLKAFAGESQATNRYLYFAKAARKEGYEQIAAFFEETAANEQNHAKNFLKFLEGGAVEITATFDAGIIGTTAENLRAAASGEKEEWTGLYPAFEKTAREEGFKEIANAFKLIATIEREHEKRFEKLLANIDSGMVFEREEAVRWKCRKCGYIHEGKKALEHCPACHHPKGYFEIQESNF
jgi:rubrerythrin